MSSFKGCLIRMSDKFIRLANVIKNPANDQVNESVEDTLIDLANYAIIAICLWREQNKKADTR
ncbi:MAG: nucleotide modification associated domain-containing protein [Chloroflexi bacterium]|nr:nucleotide modification associated domain-containing protein [Chloroflexota bacterium]